MFGLHLRMYLLLGVLFAIVYAIVTAIGVSAGMGNFYFYLAIAAGMMFFQYMIGPKIVEWSMQIRYVTPQEAPKLHQIVEELSQRAGIKKPKVGIAATSLPNACAFGRSISDGRLCVTEGILRLLNENELRAVVGHEISHIKNRDMLTITILSVVPIVLYHLAWNLMWSRNRNREGGNAMLLGLAAFIFYFITNLLVLYASRIREYFADRGSVELGNQPAWLASALYKLVYGSARSDMDSLKQVEGMKAFFVNDPSCAGDDLKDLRQLDLDRSGSIDESELLAIQNKRVKVKAQDRMMEILSTHPNMLSRVKALSQMNA